MRAAVAACALEGTEAAVIAVALGVVCRKLVILICWTQCSGGGRDGQRLFVTDSMKHCWQGCAGTRRLTGSVEAAVGGGSIAMAST